ncbi:hypothetical protein [Halobacteriovorax sp. ZH2_bin.1]|uniref:hypothetical protein n=1 Tax=Halobacteriovorax sp. ZH2_bin.1 TaxID=3157724 RepID=UPI003724BF1E
MENNSRRVTEETGFNISVTWKGIKKRGRTVKTHLLEVGKTDNLNPDKDLFVKKAKEAISANAKKLDSNIAILNFSVYETHTIYTNSFEITKPYSKSSFSIEIQVGCKGSTK